MSVHLISLPRWFGLPAALVGMLMGPALLGRWSWDIVWVLASGAAGMAWAHAANSWLDFSLTGLDRGESQERSREKLYTGGQGVIAKGLVSPREVALGAFGWLALSAALLAVASVLLSPWLWLPWLLIAPMTFWYSWAKLHWHPEVPLCLGFATFCTWLGMAAFGRPDFWLGFLGSLPLFLIWATAEQVDQAIDYEPNWPKGARSSGMWWHHKGFALSSLVILMVNLTFFTQVMLMVAGVLAWWTSFTVAALVPFLLCVAYIDKNEKKGVMWGLAGVTLYQSLLVLGQALG